MIKRFLLIAIVAAFLASCGGEATTNETDNTNDTIVSAEVNEIPTLILGEIQEKAGEYVDQEIKVVGIVDHICKHGGKKIFLVSDDADIHVNGEERFDEALTGSEITVTGIVREFRVDEGYCLQQEEDNIQSHKKGDTDEDLYEMKREQIQFYRDSMASAGVDHLSFYSLDYVSHTVNN